MRLALHGILVLTVTMLHILELNGKSIERGLLIGGQRHGCDEQ